ncbi:MAG: hypothetical protein HKN26_16840, partial [Acidimicrobiales bacterium]|nr:hypothetical protein [Acidimicrobiales bacterium]
VNVGDSVGSAVTQLTLVLGLLPIITGKIEVPRRGVSLSGTFTVIGILILSASLTDGHLGRIDALGLLLWWAIGSLVIFRRAVHEQQLQLPEAPPRRWPLIRQLFGAFILLAISASLALWAVVALAERFGAPEFFVGFFVAAIGTSLPELVFVVTALRKGAVAMAIGDVMGSSFVDSTASVAIGPLIAPTAITRDLVLRGTLASAVAIALVTILMSRIRHHDWRTGTILIALYGAFVVVMLQFA